MKTAKPAMRRTRPVPVVIAVYNGVGFFNLACPVSAFSIASSVLPAERGNPLYQCRVVSAVGGPVRTFEGVNVHTEPASALRGRPIDTLIVPGALLADDITRDRALVDWVRQRARTCRRVVAQCSGAYLLAEAGLLDGRRVTTHWAYAKRLAQRYPALNVEADPLFIRDGRIWSSAGLTAAIDLALALIEEDLGRKAAFNVARFLVVYLRRAGGQSQYSALLGTQTDNDPDGFADLEQWIAEHPAQNLSVEALAGRVNMSPRNFARVYAARRGRTPAKAVEAIRLDAARRLLEESAEQIQVVARRCGFGGEQRMRWAFLRNLGVQPREYRKRFSIHEPDPGRAARPSPKAARVRT